MKSAGDIRPRSVFTPLRIGMVEGRISPAELVQHCSERIARQSDINAVVYVDAEGAKAAASALDVQHDTRPLAGLPALVKDVEDVAGMPTTYGSVAFAEAPPKERDGAIARRLRSAGAILLGKTNTPDFAMEAYTGNALYGLTRNPWDPSRSPGGSSGGSAAALSAGLVPIATGTDGGGSSRIPASFCGLIALKPTAGLMPHDPVELPVEISGPGPLAQTTADLETVFASMLGPIEGDASCVGLPRDPDPGWPDRLLACRRINNTDPLPADVEIAFSQAVGQLEELLGTGAEEIEGDFLNEIGDVYEEWARMYAPEDAHRLAALIRGKSVDMLPGAQAWIDYGATIGFDDYLRARTLRFAFVRRVDALLGSGAVLVTPTVTVLAYGADGRFGDEATPDLPITLFNTAAFNFTGHPALSVPAGTVAGLPFGLQIVGPRLADLDLLQLAARWENAHPWPLVPPGFEPLVPWN